MTLLLAFYLAFPLVGLYFLWVRAVRASMETTAEERQRLMRAGGDDLVVFGTLRVLQSKDLRTKMYWVRDIRKDAFLRHSRFLRQDVVGLLKRKQLGFGAVPWAAMFLVICPLLRLKARIWCSYRDLFFLSGLVVLILRGLEEEPV